MQKAIPIGDKNPHSSAQPSHAPLRQSQPDVQSGNLAQLTALANRSSLVQAQLKLADQLRSSGQMQAQLAISERINAATQVPAQLAPADVKKEKTGNEHGRRPGVETVQLIAAGTLAHSDRVKVESDHGAEGGGPSQSSCDCGSKPATHSNNGGNREDKHAEPESGWLTPIQRQENGTIQRVTLKEMFDHYKDDADELGSFANWLTARAGNNDSDRDYLLHVMSKKEVIASVELYRGRKEAEEAERSITIDDVASGKAKMPSVPGKEIDTLMLKSPHIGEFAAEKAASGIKVENAVVVLHDADFMQKHWEEFCHLNPHVVKGQTPSILAGIRMREASRVDRVAGFQSEMDGKIYMRPGEIGFRIALHEAVHKYGGNVFGQVLGHVLNEGATDYIAMLVCAQIGAEIATEYYPSEKKLLIDFLGVLKISDGQLFDAYFRDNLEGILERLTATIGDEHAVLFRKAKSASEAAKAFNAGREIVNTKKASQKTAQKQVHSPAQSVVQPMIVKMQSFGADEASTEAQESNLENLRRSREDGVVDTLINLGDNPLAAIGTEETLYILGHGTGDTIDGKTAPQVLTQLEQFGYSNAHRGLIDLVSCSSAGFLKGFQAVLTQRKYTNAIKGYAGLVHITREGKTEVVPQSLTPMFLEIKNLSNKLYRKERSDLDEELGKVKEDEVATRRVEGKIKKLESDYNGIVNALNRWFDPGEEHEVFSTKEAWKKHGTPTSIAEWIEMSK